MPYTPTVWEDGNVITDVKLNNMESGITNATETAETLTETLATELPKKADNNGYYQDMTVGDAEQLVSTISTEDKVPYLFRTSGGSVDIGNRENDTIVGGTIAWNQLYPHENRWAGNFVAGTRFVKNHKILINPPKKFFPPN